MSDASNVDDSATSAWSTNAQVIQKILTIPGRIILNEMLRQLELPTPHFERRVCQDQKIFFTVIFHASRQLYPNSWIPGTISGVKSMDEAMAEHTAAVAAIRYMENHANVVVKDLNYAPLKQREEDVQVLELMLRELKNKLKKAKIKMNRLTRGCFWSVRTMFSFSEQFRNVSLISNFGGRKIINDDTKAAFANMYYTARRLKFKSIDLETKLEEIRSS